jgi:hypothetical protein
MSLVYGLIVQKRFKACHRCIRYRDSIGHQAAPNQHSVMLEKLMIALLTSGFIVSEVIAD